MCSSERGGIVAGMVVTRLARLEDVSVMGIIHVRAWQAAYRGHMPDDYLEGLSAEDRADMWERAMDRPRGHPSLLVVEREGQVLGFACVGPADTENTGELTAINVDPDAWGAGAGRALLEAAQDELRALGYREAVLWVLPGNARARRFYELAGWSNTAIERTQEVLGVTVPEIQYRRTLA
jgi:ribosomal protein S18 acetylase RimI-like enzyme